MTPEILGTIPGWITAAGVASILGIVLKWWTDNRKISIGDETTKRGERRDALHDCNTRLDAMGDRLDAVEALATSFEIKLSAALSAYKIVEVAHEAACPGSTSVQQARAVLQMAWELGELPTDILEMLKRARRPGEQEATAG